MLVLIAYLLRPRLRESHGGHARRRRPWPGRAARPPGDAAPLEAAARVRRRAAARASRRSPRSRFAPRTSRRSTKASRPRAARSSSCRARSRGRPTTRSCTTSTAGSTASPIADASARRRSRRRSACGGSTSSWQWLRDAHGTARRSRRALLAALFLVLGLLGGYVHWQRDRRSFWYFGSLMFTMTLLLIYYLNFKYGASQAPSSQASTREVRDRDYFYLWSFSAWGVWAALGLVCVWESLAALIGRRARDGRPRTRRVPTTRELAARRRRCCCSRSFRCSPTGRRRRAPGRPTRATSRATCSTRSSRTACSSPSATTTPSRSGTRRRSKESGATSSSRTRRC